MENNKLKLNVLSISDKQCLNSLVEKGNSNKCNIAREFKIRPHKYIIVNYEI